VRITIQSDMEILNVPIAILQLSAIMLLAFSIRYEFFRNEDLPFLPYFVAILSFGGVVFLVEGGLSQNLKLLGSGLLVVTSAMGLAISSMMRKK